jgi:hypothetical protein
VDGHGLFSFLHDRASGCWKRVCGLSDNLIDACGYHHGLSLWPIYLDGNGESPPHELNLWTGEIRLYRPCQQKEFIEESGPVSQEAWNNLDKFTQGEQAHGKSSEH